MVRKILGKIDKLEKKYLVMCISFLFIIIIVLFLLYDNQIKRVASQPRAILSVESYEHFPDSDAGIIEMNDNSHFRQTLIMVSTEFDGIALMVDNEKNESKGELNISLKKEDNNVIQEWSYDITQFPHKGFINFYLNEEEKTEVGDTYFLDISSENTENTTIKFQRVRGEDMSGALSVDGCVYRGIALSYRINDGFSHAIIYFFAIVSGIIILSIVVIFILLIKKIKIEKIAFFLVLFVGSLYILVIPPYVTPDEQSHISTVYAKSSEIMNKDAINNDGRVIGYNDITSYLVRREIPNANSYVQYIRWLFGRDELITKNDTFELSYSLEVGTLGYLPQIIGMTCGRIMRLNSIQILFAGRIFALLFFGIVTYLCVKLMPFWKTTMLMVAILPMTLQQAVSFSYDSVLNGILFLMTAYCFYLIYTKQSISWQQMLIIIGLCMVVIPIKFIYISLAALCILIPKEKFGGRKKKIIAVGGVALGCTTITIVTNIKRVLNLVVSSEKNKTGVESELEYYTISQVVFHPLETIEVFINTLTRDISYYVETLVGEHLGWLDIHIASIIIIGFIVLLLLSVLQKEGEQHLEKKEKCVMLGIVIVVFVLVLCSMLMAETYIGSETILGVQGRYFMPILPIILFLLQNHTVILKRSLTGVIIYSGLFLNIAAVLDIMGVLLSR